MSAIPSPAPASRVDPGRLAMHRARKRMNVIALTLSLAAMAFGLVWLIWILFETVRFGVGGLALSVFTEMTPPPQAETGGLANAIFGSLVIPPILDLLNTAFTFEGAPGAREGALSAPQAALISAGSSCA